LEEAPTFGCEVSSSLLPHDLHNYFDRRRAKAMAMAKAKQRQFEEQPEPSRPEYVFERSSRNALAFEREEPRFNSLDTPLFGRSREFSPIDRED